MKINFDYRNWLKEFKIMIKYPYYDRDTIFRDYLEMAHENILTQYLELEQDFIENEENLDYITQTRIKQATFNLANSYNENPDEYSIAEGQVQNDRQIMSILGNLMTYLK